MTILSGPDHRNSDWANDTSSFGQKMLLKMGWKQGKGLGKNQQGTNTNLRAVRREENLGIGATTDTLGEEGFTETSRNFHGVLATLKQEHGGSSSEKDKSSKKDKKRRKRDNKKASDALGGGITLSSKRVTAGHARKMREAKDLSKKSTADMAAIFGVRVEEYEENSVWGKLSSLSAGNNSSDVGEEKKEDSLSRSKPDKKDRKKKDKKKRKKKERQNEDSESGGDRKRRKKNKNDE